MIFLGGRTFRNLKCNHVGDCRESLGWRALEISNLFPDRKLESLALNDVTI